MAASRDRHSGRLTIALLALTATLPLMMSACDLWPSRRTVSVRHDPETPVAKTPLPAGAPAPHAVDFIASGEEGHVRPLMAGATAAADVQSQPSAMAVTAGDARSLDATARKDPRVSQLLGARAAFISAEAADPDSKVDFGCCRAGAPGPAIQLTYYSYATNAAVTVTMRNGAVAGLARRDGYQPPEGEEEVAAAIELGRKDDRLAGRVAGLEGRAILMEPERGVLWNDAGYGHRVLWVTFERGKSGDPLFWAVVDLSEQRVLEAGEEPHR
jgi:hypothetical protein